MTAVIPLAGGDTVQTTLDRIGSVELRVTDA
jgi:hypothetical protein